jgi:hypothetical protein
LGEDCDDTNSLVWSLNSCGKCALEPESQHWNINDLEQFHSQSPSQLLSDMLEAAKEVAPDLLITTRPGKGGGTLYYCSKVSIGNTQSLVDGTLTMSFELSHVINTKIKDKLLEDVISGSINKNNFLDVIADLEVEGYILSNEIRHDYANNLSLCEKEGLSRQPVGSQKYPSMSLQDIKNAMRNDGTLNQLKSHLKNGGFKSVRTGENIFDKHSRNYDELIIKIGNLRKSGIDNLMIKEEIKKQHGCQ